MAGYRDGRTCMFLSLMILNYISSHSSKIQKGISSARSDDTKGPKGMVLDWITKRGLALNPSFSQNVKTNRGFHHPVTERFLCPAGLNWEDRE